MFVYKYNTFSLPNLSYHVHASVFVLVLIATVYKFGFKIKNACWDKNVSEQIFFFTKNIQARNEVARLDTLISESKLNASSPPCPCHKVSRQTWMVEVSTVS